MILLILEMCLMLFCVGLIQYTIDSAEYKRLGGSTHKMWGRIIQGLCGVTAVAALVAAVLT